MDNGIRMLSLITREKVAQSVADSDYTMLSVYRDYLTEAMAEINAAIDEVKA